MSFWNVNGQNALQQAQAQQNQGSAEMGGGDLTPIPKGTKLVAMVEEAKYDTAKVFGTEEEHEILSLKWKVIDGEFKNRVIFQKIHCLPGSDQAKREKAVTMLIAIDFNAGGKLAALGRDPMEQDFMMCLSMKPMIIRVGVWETEDKSKSGNWIDGVFSRTATQPTTAAQQQQQAPQDYQTPPNDFGGMGDGDIPL